MKATTLLCSGLCLAAISLAKRDQFDATSYSSSNVIMRDAVIIGGGATGTYAAIKLRDMGKTVVLVERNGRLGGQAETYKDPTTGTPIDYGVTAYYNISVVTDFFDRFDVPISRLGTNGNPVSTPIYADFSTGQILQDFSPSPVGANYIAELDKYPYLDTGYYLPNPVPADLLLPWPEYVEKYNLEDMSQGVVSRASGCGDPLKMLAIYYFTSANHALFAEFAGAGVTPTNRDSSELYRKALVELDSNALLNSNVVAAQRPAAGASGNVKLVVKTPTGNKLIIAKQLILGIPPTLDNLIPFGLNAHEHSVLSQPAGFPYYAGVVTNTGLSSAHSYSNVGTSTLYNSPVLPGAAMFNPTLVNGVFVYWYSGLVPESQAQVQAKVNANIKALQTSIGVPHTTPEHLAFANHSPFRLVVPAASIANGWYEDMYALQGHRNTWYIGALMTISSGQLWNATAAVLPDIIAAMN
ncbi:hypothetical protein V490_02160 [Pseudogymnoascus sp. VKM F-3557]|nr:hypothetical protein V490_02160 [Pseudogymnoascus sp. VKM F-3557]